MEDQLLLPPLNPSLGTHGLDCNLSQKFKHEFSRARKWLWLACDCTFQMQDDCILFHIKVMIGNKCPLMLGL